jgi:hypothetical protein
MIAVVIIAHQDIIPQRGRPLGKRLREKHEQAQVVPDDALSSVSGTLNLSYDTRAGLHFVNDESGRWAPTIRARIACRRGDQWIPAFALTYEYDTGASFSSDCLLRSLPRRRRARGRSFSR